MKRPRIVENDFMLIEIVLVLAIAGLLLVLVFLAVSGAQRSQRDMERKTDLGLLFGAIGSIRYLPPEPTLPRTRLPVTMSTFQNSQCGLALKTAQATVWIIYTPIDRGQL